MLTEPQPLPVANDAPRAAHTLADSEASPPRCLCLDGQMYDGDGVWIECPWCSGDLVPVVPLGLPPPTPPEVTVADLLLADSHHHVRRDEYVARSTKRVLGWPQLRPFCISQMLLTPNSRQPAIPHIIERDYFRNTISQTKRRP